MREDARRSLDIEAERIVRWAWPAVVAVANALMQHGKLSGDDVRSLMAGGQPQRTAETGMSIAEMDELRASAKQRGQTALVRALDLTLNDDADPQFVRWVCPAEIRALEGGR
jgi:hypothetical protein